MHRFGAPATWSHFLNARCRQWWNLLVSKISIRNNLICILGWAKWLKCGSRYGECTFWNFVRLFLCSLECNLFILVILYTVRVRYYLHLRFLLSLWNFEMKILIFFFKWAPWSRSPFELFALISHHTVLWSDPEHTSASYKYHHCC